ncbi:MAG: hypothetical protein O3C68_00550 [Proteobacteria bacterium]|nr:hypothetical protein [Pseudomonadota bacterium]
MFEFKLQRCKRLLEHDGTLAGLAITTEAGNVAAWLENHPDFTNDWHDVINEAFTSTDQDLSMYSMTCRKLQDLCNEAGN